MRRAASWIALAAARRAARAIVADDGAATVVLSPHPDDAVLSCWSLLDMPAELLVVTVFAGLPPAGALGAWDRLTGAREGRPRMIQRREEDGAALAIARRRPIHLDLLEIEYRTRSRMLTRQVLGALAGVVSRASCVVAPLGIGGHTDHRAVRDAALTLAGEGIPVVFYADVPYAARYGWPSWVTDAPPEPFLDQDAYWRPWLNGQHLTGYAPVVRRLEPDAVQQKLEALERYQSQMPALDGGRTGVLTNSETLAYEVFWASAATAGLVSR